MTGEAITPAQWIVKQRRGEVDEGLREAKRLTAQASSHVDPARAVVDLTLAVNILIGLVEGHRHGIDGDGRYVRPLTGPMQAREGQL